MGKSKYLDLPMPYRDIANHLGLTVETLSRTVTALEKSGSIARSSWRRLVLRDHASLIRMAGR
jgi:CRP/FNR family nitrogen fixation transcriptional regulator